ncbi:MAG: L-histidine N(alpha)-methyltransferase [Pirellulaceae bacterium]
MNNQTLAIKKFRADVLKGLGRRQKTLPCKYFYDETGSRLFDEICELDEYYLTRTELAIMRDNITSIATQVDREVMLVEFGSGSSTKTRILLDALIDPIAYAPVDISEEYLLSTAEELQSSYPEIEILPVVADFTTPFSLPTPQREYSHVALYFPGSTIGNFEPDEAGMMLETMSNMLGSQGGLLIGIDLRKDVDTIVAAYDDAEGVTARFNLNLLSRINRELDANFDLDRFSHQSVYNDHAHRIEMSIVSSENQSVTIGDEVFHFAADEAILTEYSHKYSVQELAKLAAQYGFSLHKEWTDEDCLFAVLHLVLEAMET